MRKDDRIRELSTLIRFFFKLDTSTMDLETWGMRAKEAEFIYNHFYRDKTPD